MEEIPNGDEPVISLSGMFIEVVQDAVDRTGMTEVPVADRTRLLSDNGSGYVSRARAGGSGSSLPHAATASTTTVANDTVARYLFMRVSLRVRSADSDMETNDRPELPGSVI